MHQQQIQIAVYRGEICRDREKDVEHLASLVNQKKAAIDETTDTLPQQLYLIPHESGGL